jgi:hypothetical protein
MEIQVAAAYTGWLNGRRLIIWKDIGMITVCGDVDMSCGRMEELAIVCAICRANFVEIVVNASWA